MFSVGFVGQLRRENTMLGLVAGGKHVISVNRHAVSGTDGFADVVVTRNVY